MYSFSVTPEFFAVIVAGFLALAFDYFPYLAKWFDAKSDDAKKLIMAVLVIGTAVVIFAGQCVGLFSTNLVCSVKGGMDTLYMVFLALGVNQGVHKLLKPSAAFQSRMFAEKK